MFEKEKGKKERDVAPTRGQFPCPAFGPHAAQSLGVGLFGFFLGSFFLLFVFFFSVVPPFFSGFLNPNQTRYLSSIVSPGHLRTCAQPPLKNVPGSKCQKKFGDDLSPVLFEPGDVACARIEETHLPL